MTQLYIKKPSGRYQIAESDCVMNAANRLIDQTFSAGPCMTSTKTVGSLLKVRLAHKAHEVFYALFLDNKHRIIAEEEMFRGTINGATVYPREIVKSVLHHNAASVIFAHNYPSGEVEPSHSDFSITKHLKEILSQIDVAVLDHFIVGNDVYSFADNGQL
ncbi:MAG: DNA repair protein [Gammaproteobacteria bacterium]|nr:DNA repair protein [Gammaproteobacteria bacterium]